MLNKELTSNAKVPLRNRRKKGIKRQKKKLSKKLKPLYEKEVNQKETKSGFLKHTPSKAIVECKDVKNNLILILL